MPLDYDKLKAYRVPDERAKITPRDAMLYAASVGFGEDPVDERQLRFVFEKNLVAVPTMATVVAAPHGLMKKADVGSSNKSVHAGITVRLHDRIPATGEFHGKNSITTVIDKGPGKAALVTSRREVFDQSGKQIWTIDSTSMLRGDGGFGGPTEGPEISNEPPKRDPDMVCEMQSHVFSALIYRLNGDYNPLHADPETAKRNGFPRPILHGLCTFGLTGHAVMKTLCDYDETRLKLIEGRFSKPVYPGEKLAVQFWKKGNEIIFQTVVPSRNNEVVISHGRAEIG